MSMAIQNLRKRFGDLLVLDSVSFEMQASSITAILGPSGCGKTTLLNILSGILAADAGAMAGLEDKRFSYCFQEPRLLAWLSAEDNMRYAMASLQDTSTIEQRISRFLEEAGLTEFRHFRPNQLSGGMQKRLSLARAFAFPSDILLLDEAFSAVDLKQKIELMQAFLKLWKDERPTAVIVTHDMHDALFLADQVVVLSQRPARVRGILQINTSHEARLFGSNELAAYEQQLYSLLGFSTLDQDANMPAN